MKKQIRRYIVLAIHVTVFMFSPLSSYSQVTIGSAKPSASGSILQLKQNDNMEANSTKGVMLPRVKLTSVTGLSDISGSPESLSHSGLMIYSAQDNFCGLDFIYKGVHVWSGKEWQYLGEMVEQSPDVGVFVDNRDGVEYRYRQFGSAGTWMIDDLRAFVYDGSGTAPILSATELGPPHNSKQYAFPGPNGDGYNDVYFRKQPAIGLLYTWAAAINVEAGVGIANPGSADEGETGSSSTEVRQGICPIGWHIPSDKEWNDLESIIAQDPASYSTNSGTTWQEAWRTIENVRGDGHGHSMISGCQPISEPTGAPTNGKSFMAHDGGFNIMLVGDLLDDRVINFGEAVSFWSSNAQDAGAAWNRRFSSIREGVQRNKSNRSRLYSVRCKMDGL